MQEGWSIKFYILLCLSTSKIVLSVDVIVIQSKTATLHCYDAKIASQYTDYFVVVKYNEVGSTEESKEIARYQPMKQSTQIKDIRYESRLEFLSTGDIEIKFVDLRDEGTYTCIGQSFDARENRISNNIVVYVMPRIDVKKSTESLVAGAGLSSAAKCSAIGGKPAAIVNWKTDRHFEFEQVKENKSDSAELTTVESTLHIKPTKFYNNQAFYCTVSHPALPNINQTVILLNVTYPPDPPTIKVSEDHTTLTCTSNGNPTPTITWTLPPGAPTPYIGPSVVLIDPQDPKRYNDTYICTAKNGVPPDLSTNITTREASTYVQMADTSNTGMIVGIVIGCLLFLVLVVGLVYYFIIRPSKGKDSGPYKERDDVQHYPYNLEREGSSYGGRPLIEHQNSSLNKNRPPSPKGPPPNEDKDNKDDDSSGTDTDEGNHDVDVEVGPATNLNDPDFDESQGITSRASVNFQARRKRPSTSPGSRRSKHEAQMRRDSPVQRHSSNPRYDTPPGEDYDKDINPLVKQDYSGYEEDGYRDQYNQPPNYGSRYQQQQQPPRRTDSLPQYEPKYSEIDHTAYKKNPNPPRQPYNEPIEYAQIRHGYSHVV